MKYILAILLLFLVGCSESPKDPVISIENVDREKHEETLKSALTKILKDKKAEGKSKAEAKKHLLERSVNLTIYGEDLIFETIDEVYGN